MKRNSSSPEVEHRTRTRLDFPRARPPYICMPIYIYICIHILSDHIRSYNMVQYFWRFAFVIFCIFPPPVMACRRFLLQMHVTKPHHTYVCLMIAIEAGHPQLTHHNLHSHWQKKSKRRCSYKLAGNHEHDYIWVACDVFL